MNKHKLLERVQTIDQFKHIVACDTCTIEGTICDFARQRFPKVDPIEFTLLDEKQSSATQK
jgi:hypothetical protein